eukprot:TRINITY_DN13408_c0_g1_i1.p1 TRINITY_DN13408_c0_g1~~TRINITY_DN13408_c0_g1_i1.p1  ORF type:complete len:105 (-),score=12.44 TRINITY_DN13408_c0_g1_i1:61-375(-)
MPLNAFAAKLFVFCNQLVQILSDEVVRESYCLNSLCRMVVYLLPSMLFVQTNVSRRFVHCAMFGSDRTLFLYIFFFFFSCMMSSLCRIIIYFDVFIHGRDYDDD